MIEQLTTDSPVPYAVREVCLALSLSPSTYYAHRHKEQRPRRRQDRVLSQAIHHVFEESGGTYGSPRLVRALGKRGVRTSKTRVRRLMKEHGLCPIQKRRARPRVPKSQSPGPVAPHLLLSASPVQRPGERFHSDITYIPTQEGWLFTAATLDGFSRKCAGWSVGNNIEAPLVLRAAVRALASGKAPGRLHHSDQGSQYKSELFHDFLRSQQVEQSMSRRGNCYDNALMESFWATLKTECFDNFRSGIPTTRQEARQKLFMYIELFYNPKRLHSSLGYCSPAEFERNYHNQKEENR